MLTLPAEVTTEKDKQANSPVLLVEIFGREFICSTRDYDLIMDAGTCNLSIPDEMAEATAEWSGLILPGDKVELAGYSDNVVESVTSNTLIILVDGISDDPGIAYIITRPYASMLKKGFGFGLNVSIPRLINKMMSFSNTQLKIPGWRNTLRADLISSTPDLTGEAIKIYLKYKPSGDTALLANRVLIYDGYINDWSTKDDILVLKLSHKDYEVPHLPLTPLISTCTDVPNIIGTDICKPLQYGDFKNDKQHWYYEDFKDGNLAYCPLKRISPSGLGNLQEYFISQHVMDDISTGTDIWDRSEPVTFVYKDDMYVPLQGVSSLYETGSGTFINILSNNIMYPSLPPLEEWTGTNPNTPTDWADAVDGTITTCLMGTGARLQIKNLDMSKISETAVGSNVVVRLYIGFGSVSGILVYIRITRNSDSVVVAENIVAAATANNSIQYVEYTISGGTDSLNDYHYGVLHEGSSGVAYVNFLAVQWVTDSIYNSLENPYILMRCKGREYSGTWNTRKTSGNLIENPADVIESILRDDLSFSNDDIDMDSFDDVYNIFNTASIDVVGTIYKQAPFETILNNLCSSFNVSLIKSLAGKWRLIFPQASGMNFSSSGTGTPGNEDIFIDDDSITSQAFNQHPIEKGSFSIKRSPRSEVYSKLQMNYRRILDNFVKISSTGSGKTLIINSDMIGDDTSIANLRGLLDDWVFEQKHIVVFTTFWNAIAHEPGDVINIRHDDLNDSILDATVNTQKWLIIDMNFSWRPNTVRITAIELF